MYSAVSLMKGLLSHFYPLSQTPARLIQRES